MDSLWLPALTKATLVLKRHAELEHQLLVRECVIVVRSVTGWVVAKVSDGFIALHNDRADVNCSVK